MTDLHINPSFTFKNTCFNCKQWIGYFWGCSCKSCSFCKSSYSSHCVSCRKPICIFHDSKIEFLCTDNIKRTACFKCGEKRQRLLNAGDFDRGFKNIHTETDDITTIQIPSMEQRFINESKDKIELFEKKNLFSNDYIIRVLFLEDNMNPIFSCQVHIQSIYSPSLRFIKEVLLDDILNNSIIYYNYYIKNDKMYHTSRSDSYKIDFNPSKEFIKIYQLICDYPLYSKTNNLDILSSFLHYQNNNTISSLKQYDDLFDSIIEFYSNLSSINILTDISYNFKQEQYLWKDAKERRNSLYYFKNTLEKAKKTLFEYKQVYIPIIWEQEYDNIDISIDSLWCFISLSNDNEFTISFINTSVLLSSLFPDCNQVYENKLGKKYMSNNSTNNKKLNYLSSVVTNIIVQPGNSGTVNHIIYENISIKLLDRILFLIHLMQIPTHQRHPNSENFTPSTSVESFSITNMVFGNYLAQEAKYCDINLDGRTSTDFNLLEGHTINILKTIFYIFKEENIYINVNKDSTLPLSYNMSYTECFSFMEQCKYGKEYHKIIDFYRILYYIRNKDIITSKHDILFDTSQILFSKALKYPCIFPNSTLYLSEIQVLQSFLKILTKERSTISLNELLKPQKSNIPFLPKPNFDEETKNLCFSTITLSINKNISRILPDNIFDVETLQQLFVYMPFDDLNNLWNKWLLQLKDIINKDIIKSRIILNSMIESLPEFDNEYWNTMGNMDNSRSIALKWLLIIHKIVKYITILYLRRLGKTLHNFTWFLKRVLYPDEYYNLLKCCTILKKIHTFWFITEHNKDAMFFEGLFMEQASKDKYLQVYKGKQRSYFLKMLLFLNISNNTYYFLGFKKMKYADMKYYANRLRIIYGHIPYKYFSYKECLPKAPTSVPIPPEYSLWINESINIAEQLLIIGLEEWNTIKSNAIRNCEDFYSVIENILNSPDYNLNHLCVIEGLSYEESLNQQETLLYEINNVSDNIYNVRETLIEVICIIHEIKCNIIILDRLINIHCTQNLLLQKQTTFKCHSNIKKIANRNEQLYDYYEEILKLSVSLKPLYNSVNIITDYKDYSNISKGLLTNKKSIKEKPKDLLLSNVTSFIVSRITTKIKYPPNIPYNNFDKLTKIDPSKILKHEILYCYLPPSNFIISSVYLFSSFCIKPRSISDGAWSTIKNITKTGIHAFKRLFSSKKVSLNKSLDSICFMHLKKYKESLENINLLSIGRSNKIGLSIISIRPFGVKINSNDILLCYSEAECENSYYSHGLEVSTIYRDKLIRHGIDNRISDGYNSLSILSKEFNLLPSLNGEINLTQDICFDYSSPTWDYSFPKVLSTNIQNSNDDNEYFKDFSNTKFIFSGSILIHTLMGALSIDRLFYYLSEPSLQWSLELIVFRPSIISYICREKPQFLKTLQEIFNNVISSQKLNNNYSNQIYLNNFFYRIIKELEISLKEYPNTILQNTVYSLLKTNNYIEFIHDLYYCHINPYLLHPKPIKDTINRDNIIFYKLSIHKYYLLYIRDTYSVSELSIEQISGLIISSYILTIELQGVKNTSIDLYEIQLLREWLIYIFTCYKDKFINETFCELLFPISKMFFEDTPQFRPSNLNDLKWQMNFPEFIGEYSLHDNNNNNNITTHQIIINPLQGYILFDGQRKSLIKDSILANKQYQSYFGLKNYICLHQRTNKGYDSYTFQLKHPELNIITKYRIISKSEKDIVIYREIQDCEKLSYYELSFDFYNIENISNIPLFISQSVIWGKIDKSNKGLFFYSTKTDNPSKSIIEYASFITINDNDKDNNTIIIDKIVKYPSGDIVNYFYNNIPSVLTDFEHPRNIEFRENIIYLPRYNLTFTYIKGLWMSNEIKGYYIYERKSVNTFEDFSRYWLSLRSTIDDTHSYIFIASDYNLLTYNPYNNNNNNNKKYRLGTRRVYLDTDIYSKDNISRKYFTITFDNEYPSNLHTGNIDNQFWIIRLYYAKREYMNCSCFIDTINTSSFTYNQLYHIQQMIKWQDYSYYGCLIKLKLISFLCLINPNIFIDLYDKTEDNKKDEYFDLTKDEWHYLFFKISKNIDFISLLEIKLKIKILKQEETKYITISSNYLYNFLSSLLKHSNGKKLLSSSVYTKKSMKLIDYKSIDNILNNIDKLSNTLSVFLSSDIITKTIYSYYKSYEFNIYDFSQLSITKQKLFSWTKYFVSIYNKLSQLSQDDLLSWIYIMSCNIDSGYIIDRYIKILLIKLSYYSYQQNELPNIMEDGVLYSKCNKDTLLSVINLATSITISSFKKYTISHQNKDKSNSILNVLSNDKKGKENAKYILDLIIKFINIYSKNPYNENISQMSKYSNNEIGFPLLQALGNEYFNKITISNEKLQEYKNIWNTQSDLLFNKKHYNQEQHITFAKLLQEGFNEALLEEKIDYKIINPTKLLEVLYSCRVFTEQQESYFFKELINILSISSLYLRSSINSGKNIPIQVLLNLWENNKLYKLYDLFLYNLSQEQYNLLDDILEKISINICWRYHIENIINKYFQIQYSDNPIEKQYLINQFYLMFFETLKYKHGKISDRKILALSRTNKFLIRKNQVSITNELIMNPNQAIQAALGLGKSSVIVPLVTDAFCDGIHSTWIICTLADKADTIKRAEIISNIFHHPIIMFHFKGDGSISDNYKKSHVIKPYKLDTIQSLKILYNDLLNAKKYKSIIITTRESLLYFIDMFEFYIIQRSNEQISKTTQDEYNEIIEYYSKFFDYFSNESRAVLDEIDEILKSNLKVNIALSNISKIDKNILSLAIYCTKILLDPTIYIQYNNILLSLPKASKLIENHQAGTSPHIKELIREKLAEIMAYKYFKIPSNDYKYYQAYILNYDKPNLSLEFYNKYIRKSNKSADYIRFRELLGLSYNVIFKRHNYSIGRMFTNSNQDDVGPYSAVNFPIANSHLSSEYDWAWALSINYAIMGITPIQCNRIIQQIRSENILNQDNNDPYSFQSFINDNIYTIFEDSIPDLVKKFNDNGDWMSFDWNKLLILKELIIKYNAQDYIKQYLSINLYNLFINTDINELSIYDKEQLSNIFFHSNIKGFNINNNNNNNIWEIIINEINNHNTVGINEEKKKIEYFKGKIGLKLQFLEKYVNLQYYSSFVEGNAGTIVHIFKSICGFSGTMEVPLSIPQKLLHSSSPNLLRNRKIDGIIIQRFLSYALKSQYGNFNSDSTMYVEDAAKLSLTRGKSYSKNIQSKDIIKNSTQEILYSCFDSQAIVDGGALLDEKPLDIIKTLLSDNNILDCIQDPSKDSFLTIRWKYKGNWVTIDLPQDPNDLKIINQSQRSKPLNLSRTLTFYDQLHSRGTDAKLAPTANMINTIGDETRLTEWFQSEGRARQSGRGQTSRSIIASHIRNQQTGDGSLSFQILRTLIKRSSNSEVSESFYANAEQIRNYKRDYLRSSIAKCLNIGSTKDKQFLYKLANNIFSKSSLINLSSQNIILSFGIPSKFTDAETCLNILKKNEIDLIKNEINSILKTKYLSNNVKKELNNQFNYIIKTIQSHIIPSKEYLPKGNVGIPKIGEQSFAIVLTNELNQEVDQDIAIDVETEIEHESDIEFENQMDLERAKPSDSKYIRLYFPWHLSSIDEIVKILKNTITEDNSSSVFIPLKILYPKLYTHSIISKNFGIDLLTFAKQKSLNLDFPYSEDSFHWMYHSYVDPYTYHIAICSNSYLNNTFYSLTLSHQEYSEYIFPLLLANKEDYNGYQVGVYRYIGWKWVCIDSTTSKGIIDLFNEELPAFRRIKAEWCLLSGILEIGSVYEQISFLELFINKDITSLHNYIIKLFTNTPDTFFRKSILITYKELRQMESQLYNERTVKSFITKYSSNNIGLYSKECKILVQNIQDNNYTKDQCKKEITNNINNYIYKEFIYLLLTTNNTNIFNNIFNDNLKTIISAKTQVLTMIKRQNPSLNKKIQKAPMIRLLDAIINLLTNHINE